MNMDENIYSEKELKLTAAVYATRDAVVETIRETGKLPETIELGGFPIATNVIIRQRGTDITLTEDEQLVYDAILRERRLPGGSVRLVEDYKSGRRSNDTP
jgi:hypothetical protein